MPMQAQPAGTSRVRLTPKVENPETGKPFPADKFGIDYADPDYGKQRIGETHRVKEGKRRGWWEPKPAVPASVLKGQILLLDPVPRHNDAIEYLVDVWKLAKSKGWKPEVTQKQQEPAAVPEPSLAEQLRDSLQPAPEGQADRWLEPVSAPLEPEWDTSATAEEMAAAREKGHAARQEMLDGLPEMEGVPVVPVPPGVDVAQLTLPAVARADVASSQEHGEVIREIPAGHPDDPSAGQPGIPFGISEPVQPDPAAPIVLNMEAPAVEGPQHFNPIPSRVPDRPYMVVPHADPAVQKEVVLADDWLDQPPTPGSSFAPDDGDPFPLDFPK